MKILELRSENFKRLRAVSIRPDGSLIQITGRNGHGKTSVLDSIAVALGGKAFAPAEPIRKGADQCTIRLALGDKTAELIVTRRFKRTPDGEYTTSLSVESPEGGVFRSPQAMLDALLAELTFDPLKFARAQPEEQLDMLKRLVPGVDFAGIERLNQRDYEARRDLNRRAKELRTQAAAIALPTEPLKPIDETALVKRLEEAGEQNAEIERRKARREAVSASIKQLRASADAELRKAEDLRRRAQELIEQAANAEQQANEHSAEADALATKLANAEDLPAPIDTAEIRDAIEHARHVNRQVEQAQRRRELEAQAETVEAEAASLTAAMEMRNEEKAAAIAAANLPVPGLAFDAASVTLNGVPFSQASDAEQLRASIAIAAALAGKLKVIRVRDGSLLDEDGLKILANFAEQHDMQIWLEKVDSSGKVGFIVENGELVAAKTEAAA